MTERDFLLPDLGEGLEEAEINTWRVAVGDRIELNQPLVDVDTAKALVEIPSPFAGTVVRLHGAEGDIVKVGSPLVTIAVEGDEPTGSAPAPAPAAEAEDAPRRRAVLVGYGVEEDEPAAKPTSTGSGRGAARDGERDRSGPVKASPPVRKLAKELGVDLGGVVGTGPGGRITREDVQQAGSAAGARGARERIPVRGPRRLIAEKMARSWRDIPHVTTFLTVDASHLLAFREEIEQRTGRRVSPLAVVVRALAEVTREHPLLNASFDAEAREIVVHGEVNVGIATDTDRGLLVPVVRGVDGLGITAVAARIAELVGVARDATIAPEAFSGGTITVTNVGTFGSEFGTPIINHPEGAILALGLIQPRALVVEDRVEARPAVTLSLSFDHRLLDGAEAGRALRTLADLLESPFRLGALPR